MTDLYHLIGDDLTCSSTGDLKTVEGLTLGNQRVLRRLLTAPGSYIWHPDYGAGLRACVGRNLSSEALIAVIRNQLALESAVATDPPPVITLAPITDGVVVTIRYVDAGSQQPAVLSLNVTP